MQKFILSEPTEVGISAADLEAANLNEWERLELHLLDQAAVVIPGQMSVMEVIRTAEALQGMVSDLLAAIGDACEKCDGCHVELLCDLMKGKIQPEVHVPPHVLEEAGADRMVSLPMRSIQRVGISVLWMLTIAMICRMFLLLY